MNLTSILSHFNGVKQTGTNTYMALCPAHDDKNPSLSIRYSDEENRICLHCFAGCDRKEILRCAGLNEKDLFERKYTMKKTEYTYHYENGEVAYRKFRFEREGGKKSFSFEKPDGTKGLENVRRVPYNLPAVLDASTVYFVEGEKCAEALIENGLTATTLDSGSNSKWQAEYAKYFEGKQVYVIPDHDTPGKSYANRIARSIPGAKILPLPGLAEKEDVFDWLAAGHTVQELPSLPTEAPESEKLTEKKELKGTQTEIIITALENADCRVFFDQLKQPFLQIPADKGIKVLPLSQGSDFKKFASMLLFQETKKAANAETIRQVADLLEAKAMAEGQEQIPLSVRVAAKEDVFYYDLTGKEFQIVEVTPEGWRVTNQKHPIFRRYTHQNEQVLPQNPGDVRRILKHINLKENHTLFLCWLVSCFVPDIPHTTLILFGEKGSAKSTASGFLKSIIDPSQLETLSMPHDMKSLAISLQQHWFLPFDNLSLVNQETSDMLCKAITGGGIQQRKLFSDADDYIFTFKRCICMNGINNVVRRADLLDRSLLMELQRIPDTQRKEEAVVKAEFQQDLPYILGGVFDTLAKAMAIFPNVKLNRLPRMADFARWGYAIGEALGGLGNAFLQEYEINRELQNREAISSDVVATLLLAFMEDRQEWKGRISELQIELIQIAPEHGISTKSQDFPSQPNVLARRLNGIQSNLEAAGITFRKRSTMAGTVITLQNNKLPPLASYSQELPDYQPQHGGYGDYDGNDINKTSKEDN